MKVSRRRRTGPQATPAAGADFGQTRTIVGLAVCNGYEVTVTAALEAATGPSARGPAAARRDRSPTNR